LPPAFKWTGFSTIRFLLPGILVLAFLIVSSETRAEQAIPETEAEASDAWHEHVDSEWGGRVRLRAMASWVEDDSFFKLVDTDTNSDANVEVRLKGKLFFGDWGYLDTHYEAVAAGGDTREKLEELKERFPVLEREGFILGAPIDDDRRLLDLTKVFSENDSHIAYHRIDRLALTLLPEWGTVRVGRQVITWGNGFLFNPMDLFNPFAPTDIERDYKVGDDMVTCQFPVGDVGDLQFLYVPRRDPDDHDVEWDDESSFAGKLHFARGVTEFDLMAARHYEDSVVGIGAAGYLRDAAWRTDATWTFLRDAAKQDGYLSLAANMDYSWVWGQKNVYGFLEFYYNGLGEDDPSDALANSDLIERIERGELFTLGHAYLTGSLQVELHPLFNVFVSVINNLNDPSGIFQPRATWSLEEYLELAFGANITYGKDGSEFGGIEIPGTNLITPATNSIFVWLTCYF